MPHYLLWKLTQRVLIGIAILGVGCVTSQKTEEEKYSPSGIPAFNASNYSSFDDYVTKTKEQLSKFKVYMDDNNSKIELNSSFPFQMSNSECSSIEKGIVLVHGLSNTPFAMKDLSTEFSDRCFLVRTILLPGHGTRAGDMLNVTKDEWVESVDFAISTLKQDVDNIYVGGFSLGGLLSVNAAINDSDIKGVFAFSPALSIHNPIMVRQTLWLRNIINWLDTDNQDDFARYEAMPVNGIAETYLLSSEPQDKLKDKGLSTPVFMAQSSDDLTIDSEKNRNIFLNNFYSKKSTLISYDSHYIPSDNDPRILDVNVVDIENKIASYSHQSVHISPDNRHYGKNGTYRNCGVNSTDRTREELSECLYSKHPWRGEILKDNGNLPVNPNTMVRLTYNPKFKEMMSQIDDFLLKIQ